MGSIQVLGDVSIKVLWMVLVNPLSLRSNKRLLPPEIGIVGSSAVATAVTAASVAGGRV